MEQEEELLQVYPNPVHDRLQVVASGVCDIQLVDVMGRHLLRATFIDQTQLDFSNYERGTYFLVVNGEVVKVVK